MLQRTNSYPAVPDANHVHWCHPQTGEGPHTAPTPQRWQTRPDNSLLNIIDQKLKRKFSELLSHISYSWHSNQEGSMHSWNHISCGFSFEVHFVTQHVQPIQTRHQISCGSCDNVRDHYNRKWADSHHLQRKSLCFNFLPTHNGPTSVKITTACKINQIMYLNLYRITQSTMKSNVLLN